MNIMSPLPWSQETCLQFIHLYGKERVLWDKSFPGNKNMKNTQAAWERIQEAMDVECTIDELKRKKESLMAGFRLQCKKAKSDPDYQCSWFAYHAMRKYLGHLYFDNSSCEDEEEVYISTQKDEDSIDHIYLGIAEEKVSNRCNTDSTDAPTSVKRKIKMEQKNPSYIYIQSQKGSSTSLTEDRLNSQTITSKPEMDECELYGQLLVTKLRKLNEHQRDVAMHEIDNILYKIKMQRTTTTSNPSVFVLGQGSQLENQNSDTIQFYEDNPLCEQ